MRAGSCRSHASCRSQLMDRVRNSVIRSEDPKATISRIENDHKRVGADGQNDSFRAHEATVVISTGSAESTDVECTWYSWWQAAGAIAATGGPSSARHSFGGAWLASRSRASMSRRAVKQAV